MSQVRTCTTQERPWNVKSLCTRYWKSVHTPAPRSSGPLTVAWPNAITLIKTQAARLPVNARRRSTSPMAYCRIRASVGAMTSAWGRSRSLTLSVAAATWRRQHTRRPWMTRHRCREPLSFGRSNKIRASACYPGSAGFVESVEATQQMRHERRLVAQVARQGVHIVDGIADERHSLGLSGHLGVVVHVLVRVGQREAEQLIIALQHVGAKTLERGAVGAAGGDHIAQHLQIDPGLAGARKGLGQDSGVAQYHELVQQFGGMPGADRPAVKDVLSKQLKDRASARQYLRVAPHQQVELAFVGMLGRTGHGRIQELAPFGSNGLGHAPGGVGQRGRAVPHTQPGLRVCR